MFVDASQSEIEKEQYVGGIDTDCVKEEVCVIQWCLCTLVLVPGTRARLYHLVVQWYSSSTW